MGSRVDCNFNIYIFIIDFTNVLVIIKDVDINGVTITVTTNITTIRKRSSGSSTVIIINTTILSSDSSTRNTNTSNWVTSDGVTRNGITSDLRKRTFAAHVGVTARGAFFGVARTGGMSDLDDDSLRFVGHVAAVINGEESTNDRVVAWAVDDGGTNGDVIAVCDWDLRSAGVNSDGSTSAVNGVAFVTAQYDVSGEVNEDGSGCVGEGEGGGGVGDVSAQIGGGESDGDWKRARVLFFAQIEVVGPFDNGAGVGGRGVTVGSQPSEDLASGDSGTFDGDVCGVLGDYWWGAIDNSE